MRKLTNTALCLLVMCFVIGMASVTVRAAEDGTMISNAVNITFGETYTKTWTTRTDHLNHYCKITVPSRGIIDISATKPRDDEGEYGRLYFFCMMRMVITRSGATRPVTPSLRQLNHIFSMSGWIRACII